MNKIRGSAALRGLSVVCAAAMCWSMAALAQSPDEAALKRATVNGKYTRLLTVLYMPGDKATYKEFTDYGPYNGTAWGNYKGLPQGNWVYVYPYWYIWGEKGPGGHQLPLKRASVDGKYSKLLTVINMPGDMGTYGQFSDYGAYNGDSWGTYKGLPSGYWVYVAPHWYIWGQKK